MNRFLVISAVIICFFAIFVGDVCANNSERGRKHAQELADGNFEAVYNDFSTRLKEKLPLEKVREVWEAVTKNLGRYKGIVRDEVSAKNGLELVSVILEFEKNGLKSSFVYAEDGEIESWIIGFSPLEQSLTVSDKFEEVRIFIGEHKLAGVMTLPKAVKNPPVAILISGSGPNDMDETIGASANKPFRDIAHGLAVNGIASIRYNKLTFQFPGKFKENATVQSEYLNDARAAIKFARDSKSVNGKKIFLLGHSQGGMVLPYLVSVNPEVTGIILLASPAEGLEMVGWRQRQSAINAMEDKSQEEKDELLAKSAEIRDEIKNLKSGDEPSVILGVPSGYWISLNEIDVKTFAEKLRLPVLVLMADCDFQVSSDVYFEMWKDTLKNDKKAEFKLYKNLNHLFMPSDTGKKKFVGLENLKEYDAEAHVDKGVIDDISNWINKF